MSDLLFLEKNNRFSNHQIIGFQTTHRRHHHHHHQSDFQSWILTIPNIS